jgi:hypothetical protein
MWKPIVLFALLSGGLCAADSAACPSRVDVQRQQLAKPIAGWTAAQVQDAHHDLWFVTLYDGEPKDMASLVPDSTGRLKTSWTLAPGRTYWLECHYTRTTIVLSRQVAAGAKLCEATYQAAETLDGHPVIKQVACK